MNKKTGIELITEERMRQVMKLGHTNDKDLQNNKKGALGMAAICYISNACTSTTIREVMGKVTPKYWPWDDKQWKPAADSSYSSRIRELQKAGALIAAEIDYMQSLKKSSDH